MASTATQKGNRGQNKAREVLAKWARKKFKSSNQSGMPGYNHDPHKGDILCDTEGHYFPFTVEVKNYAKIQFNHLLQPNVKVSDIETFWRQCEGDAKRCKKIPMLLMRYDRLPADFFFVVITNHFASAIGLDLSLANSDLKHIRYYSYPKDRNDVSLRIFGSDQFFKSDYKAVKKVAKSYLKSLYK
jgi:hypothetical protein